jgi:hypothetical protein
MIVPGIIDRRLLLVGDFFFIRTEPLSGRQASQSLLGLRLVGYTHTPPRVLLRLEGVIILHYLLFLEYFVGR